MRENISRELIAYQAIFLPPSSLSAESAHEFIKVYPLSRSGQVRSDLVVGNALETKEEGGGGGRRKRRAGSYRRLRIRRKEWRWWSV